MHATLKTVATHALLIFEPNNRKKKNLVKFLRATKVFHDNFTRFFIVPSREMRRLRKNRLPKTCFNNIDLTGLFIILPLSEVLNGIVLFSGIFKCKVPFSWLAFGKLPEGIVLFPSKPTRRQRPNSASERGRSALFKNPLFSGKFLGCYIEAAQNSIRYVHFLIGIGHKKLPSLNWF